MTEQPKTAVVISGPAEYSAAKGAIKAATQTGLAWASILLPALVASLSDPQFQSWILAAVKDKPWAPLVAIVLQFSVVMLLNYQKNREPKALIEAATVGTSPAAATASVQGQLDQGESPAPEVVLTEEPKAK